MERSKPDALMTWLEWRKKDRAARRPVTAGTAFSVLAALADVPQGAVALSDLQQASGMSFFDFSQALGHLVETGYVTVGGQPGSETAQLTKIGAEVAEAARPA
jgi:DNA-binding IclR family transcriptional regulator